MAHFSSTFNSFNIFFCLLIGGTFALGYGTLTPAISGGIGTRWNKGPCWESQVIGNSNVTLASIVRWSKVTYVIFYSGIEALYADLCHFPVLAIQVSGFNQKESWSMIYLPEWINHVSVQMAFTLVVFPCLIIATLAAVVADLHLDINWVLMILCIVVTAGFRNQSR